MTMEQPKASTSIFEASYKGVMWRKTLRLTFYLYVALLWAMYLIDGSITFVTISKVTAAAAALLIGFSFALSGFCYYWDFLDSKIGLRKYLGLMGFWLALAYSLSLLVVDPDRYFFGFFRNFWTVDFILGLISMAFFTFMAFVSRDSMMRKMGPHRWRMALRWGYVAWLFLAIRAAIIEQDIWIAYFRTLKGFPPPRLLLSLYVVAIILFRLAVEVSKHMKNAHKAETRGEVAPGV